MVCAISLSDQIVSLSKLLVKKRWELIASMSEEKPLLRKKRAFLDIQSMVMELRALMGEEKFRQTSYY